jgi:hypothetical protein
MKTIGEAVVAVAIYAATWVRAKFAKGHAAKFRLWAACEKRLAR